MSQALLARPLSERSIAILEDGRSSMPLLSKCCAHVWASSVQCAWITEGTSAPRRRQHSKAKQAAASVSSLLQRSGVKAQPCHNYCLCRLHVPRGQHTSCMQPCCELQLRDAECYFNWSGALQSPIMRNSYATERPGRRRTRHERTRHAVLQLELTSVRCVVVDALPRDSILGCEALLLTHRLIRALVEGRGVQVAPPWGWEKHTNIQQKQRKLNYELVQISWSTVSRNATMHL